MSAEHNHPPFCCCHGRSPQKASERPCPSCPEHGPLAAECLYPQLDGDCGWSNCPKHGAPLATPYTEQETTNG